MTTPAAPIQTPEELQATVQELQSREQASLEAMDEAATTMHHMDRKLRLYGHIYHIAMGDVPKPGTQEYDDYAAEHGMSSGVFPEADTKGEKRGEDEIHDRVMTYTDAENKFTLNKLSPSKQPSGRPAKIANAARKEAIEHDPDLNPSQKVIEKLKVDAKPTRHVSEQLSKATRRKNSKHERVLRAVNRPIRRKITTMRRDRAIGRIQTSHQAATIARQKREEAQAKLDALSTP